MTSPGIFQFEAQRARVSFPTVGRPTIDTPCNSVGHEVTLKPSPSQKRWTRTVPEQRLHLGVVIPSVNRVVEPYFGRSLPDTADLHVSRMYWDGPASIESVKAMDRLGGEAVDSLATARPDAILYGCTATTLVTGRQYDLDLMQGMTARTGVSVISTTEAILRAFQALDVNSISIASPYPSEIDELETAFFRECGIEVSTVESLHMEDAFAISEVERQEIIDLGRKAATADSDAIFISCLNLRGHEAIPTLEEEIGRPVVTSTQAGLWALMNEVGGPPLPASHGRLTTAHND